MLKRFICFLLFATLIAEEEIVEPPKSFQAIVIDPDFSPFAGGYDILFAHHLLTSTEDYFFRDQDRRETGSPWWRAIEMFAIWYPIDMLASVTQHEVFGHGYRMRDEGVTIKGYTVSPWGGATQFEPDPSLSIGEFLALVVGGLDGEFILARLAKMNWIRTGKIDGRMSALYNQAQQSLFWYTSITSKGELESPENDGNDIKIYLEFYNLSYPDDRLSINDLSTWAAFNWLDPMTFYSYFALFYYIGTGQSWEFPMIPITEGVRYLPNARIGYAPYGPEAYWESFFSINDNPLYFYFKGGKRSAGAGISYNHAFENSWLTVGGNFDVWNQGKFITSATLKDFEEDRPLFRPALEQKQWGMAASVTGIINIKSYAGLFLEIGGKTSGYLPGYSLDKDVTARIGVVIK